MTLTIGAIPIFVAVLDAGSFTGAADRLGVTKSAVSRRISDLEDDLGVRLLHRTTRRLSLTEAGERYLRYARRALSEAQAAEDAASSLQDSPRGHLRINTPMSFGRLHVAPAIPDFLARYPDIRVEMTMEDRTIDLVEGGYDVGIRVGVLAESSLIARRLAPSRNVVCATPAYLEQHPPVLTPRDLLQHNCLRYAYFSEANEWTFTREDQREPVRVSGSYQVNNSEALREAVLAGVGVARVPLFVVGEDLRRGRLTRVLPHYDMPAQYVHAVWPERAYLPRKVRVFVDFLRDRIGGEAPVWESGEH